MRNFFSFFTQNAYRKDITLVILLKLVLLWLLWEWCFSGGSHDAFSAGELVRHTLTVNSSPSLS